jgi:alpha-glucosidase (family GH31 glycosyl hydrolase)
VGVVCRVVCRVRCLTHAVRVRVHVRVRAGSGKDPYIGKVWPGSTAWPDFFHPDSDQYWSTSIKGFLSTVPVDGNSFGGGGPITFDGRLTWHCRTTRHTPHTPTGLWTDMNEPANFCDGYCDAEAPKRATSGAFDPNYPPYAINNRNCRYECFPPCASVCGGSPPPAFRTQDAVVVAHRAAGPEALQHHRYRQHTHDTTQHAVV